MRRNDDGQITLLSIGFAVVAMALVFVVVSVSALYLDRKTLQAAADMIALDAASQLPESYFANPDGVIHLTDDDVASAASDYLAAYGTGIGVSEARLTAPTGSPDGRTAVVTLATRADVILIPGFVNLPSFIEISVTSQARAGD